MPEPTIGASLTRAMMIATVFIWVAWDVLALWYWGPDATISHVMLEASIHTRAFLIVLVFCVGVLIGHWFLPIKG